ncbi:beta-prism lectin domain-containing protein [Serratia marcescens]|uniref:beta-prism lectin domain-containing protein n=1 Tax=Serratia marcescens TaxID=615 RepID=UPI0027E4B376|nr:beta-prism lectin domain-containing protein [Serratia marcescens]MCS3414698.1 Ig-like domain-containing protein [Serratia marcescens]
MSSLSGKPDSIQSSLKIEPDKLFSDGAATAKVILELVDLHGNKVEDEKNVRFLISQNRGVKVGAVTNNNGIYTATIIGTGDFFGTVDVTVNIDNRDLSGLSAELILYAQPIVKEVEITGTRRIGEALNLTYNFDARGTQGDDSSYLWQYLDNHSRWQNANVSGSRNQGFTLVGPHAGNMIKVWVLPKSKIPPVISARVASSPVMLFDVPEIQDKKVTIKGSGQVGQKLQAEYGFVANGTGADDSAVKWQWSADGKVWADHPSSGVVSDNARVYTPGSGDAGVMVRGVVTPKGKNQSLTGVEVASVGVTIFAAPAVKDVKVTSTTVEAGKSLGVSYAFVTNGTGTDASTYQWKYRQGTSGDWTTPQSADAKKQDWKPDATYAGYQVRLTITPKGALHPELPGVPTDGPEISIFAAPAVKDVKVTSTTVEAGKSLGVSYAFVTNGTGTDASTYQWKYRQGTSGDWTTPQSADAKKQDWKPDATYAGYQVRLTITPKGALHPELPGVPTDGPEISIFAAPAVRDNKVTIKGSGQVGQKLQAEYGFVANGTGADDSTVEWQWRYQSGSKWSTVPELDGNDFIPEGVYKGVVVRACVTPKGKEQSIKGSEVCVAGSDLMTIYSYDFSITPSSKAITEGGQFLFSVRAAPTNGQASIGVVSGIDWRIADTSIASIDNNGKVKGKKAGDTEIHASGNYKGIKFDDVTATLSVKGNHLSPVYGKPSVGDSEKKYIIQPPSYSLKMRTGYVVDAIGTSEDLTGGSGGNNVTIDNLANLISIEVTTGRYNHAPNAVTISTIKFNYKDGRIESAGLSRDMDKGSLRTEVYTIPSGYVLQGFIVHAAKYSHAIQFVSMPQE